MTMDLSVFIEIQLDQEMNMENTEKMLSSYQTVIQEKQGLPDSVARQISELASELSDLKFNSDEPFLVYYNKGEKEQLKIGNSFTIGRHRTNSLVVSDPDVSNKHCCISFDGDDYTIEDLGSSNGTFVNHIKTDKRILCSGDIIEIAKAYLVFLR